MYQAVYMIYCTTCVGARWQVSHFIPNFLINVSTLIIINIKLFLPSKRALFIGWFGTEGGLCSRRWVEGLQVWNCPDPIWHSWLNLLLTQQWKFHSASSLEFKRIFVIILWLYKYVSNESSSSICCLEVFIYCAYLKQYLCRFYFCSVYI